MPIDTLKSKRRLVEEYGMDDRQAEGIVDLIASSEERALTRSDLESIESRLDRQEIQIEKLGARIDEVEESLNARIDHVEESLNARIDHVEESLGIQMEKGFEAQNAELKNYVTSRVGWAAGLLALYLTLLNYVTG
jgi:tRNA U34 5-carboxymethylaminomethyl modifying GTPase MnmE/TrmE